VYVTCIAVDQGAHGCTDFVTSTAAVYSLALPCNGNQCLERRDLVHKTDPRKFLDRPAQIRFEILSCWRARVVASCTRPTDLDVLHADADSDEPLIRVWITRATLLHQTLHATEARRRDEVAHGVWKHDRELPRGKLRASYISGAA
jgi:hypothetical protein